jgi:uncharacterized protein involved in exopolysaccharide biosynthesis
VASSSFLDFGKFLYRRRGVVALTAASAALTAGLVSFALPSVYQATCEFFVTEPIQPPTFFSPDGGTGAANREVLLPVITQERERSYLGLLESVAVWQRVHREVPEKPFETLDRDVDIEVTRKHIIRVTARDHDPGIAARTSNAYVKALDDFLFETSTQRQDQTSTNMTQQLARTRDELANASKELTTFQRSVETADVPREVQEIIDRRSAMEAALEQARVQLSKVESQISSAKARQLVDRVAEYEVEHAALVAEVKERKASLDDLTSRTQDLASQQRREEQLRANVARLQNMVDNLTRSVEESRAQGRSREDQVVVVKEAHPPVSPILPLPIIDAVVGLGVGLIAGLYLALLLDYIGRVTSGRRRPPLRMESAAS